MTRFGAIGSLAERHATRDRHRHRLSRGLVVAQVALSLALVTGTGLLIRSLAELHAVDLGFRTEGVVTFALEAPDWGDDDETVRARMLDYLDRVRAVSGVSQVGFSNRIPLAGGLFTGAYRTEAMVAVEDPAYDASFRYITPGYLEALGAYVSAGRAMRPSDGADTIVIDETAAQRAWPGENPLGKRLEIQVVTGEPVWAEVIGVVAPMKHAGVAEPTEATIFTSMLARPQQNFRYMAVRVEGDPLAYLEPMRAAVREVDAHAVIARVRTMDELFREDLSTARFATLLLSLFGLTALLLASVGLHGVMAVSLKGRRREMGIRMALGAEPGAILRKAAASGAALVGLGVLAGTILSLGLGRALEALLYDVEPTDATALLVAALVISAVGLLAAYLPARFVLAVDPADTLREE